MAAITGDLKVLQNGAMLSVLPLDVGIEKRVDLSAQPIIESEETRLLDVLARRLDSAEKISLRMEQKIDGVDRNVSMAVTAGKVVACLAVFVDAGVSASTVVGGLLCAKGTVVVG